MTETSPETQPASGKLVPEARQNLRQPGLLSAVQSLLLFLICGTFLTTFTVQPIRIPSSSMQPTLLVGDFLLLDRQATPTAGRPGVLPPAGVRHGDIIVFHDPVDPAVHLVKRIVGVPGDRVHLRAGVVWLNGHPLAESYAVHTPGPTDAYRDDFPTLETNDVRVDPAWWMALRHLVHEGELTVPPGDYFVLGDNRSDSEDSRYWGFVPSAAIVGEPVLVYFSWRQPDDRPASQARGSLAFARWSRSFHIVH